ncbi:MAG: outer membrane beta-barrel protein [Saprospiraceae bacterium]|nr:outer membrane beta-barrel protein [Saprospiraceae bacterium]
MKLPIALNSKLVVFLFIVFIQGEVLSQVTIGTRGGINISRLNYYFDDIKLEDQESLNKFEAGVFLDLSLNSKFSYVLELNYFESGISIPSIPFKLNTTSIETNSMLRFQLIQGVITPSLLVGIGVNKYLEATDTNGSNYDFGKDDIYEFGIGYLLGFQIDYAMDKYIVFFDTRLKNSFNNFIDNTTNEDFTIRVRKEEIILSVGLKYKL